MSQYNISINKLPNIYNDDNNTKNYIIKKNLIEYDGLNKYVNDILKMQKYLLKIELTPCNYFYDGTQFKFNVCAMNVDNRIYQKNYYVHQ